MIKNSIIVALIVATCYLASSCQSLKRSERVSEGEILSLQLENVELGEKVVSSKNSGEALRKKLDLVASSVSELEEAKSGMESRLKSLEEKNAKLQDAIEEMVEVGETAIGSSELDN